MSVENPSTEVPIEVTVEPNRRPPLRLPIVVTAGIVALVIGVVSYLAAAARLRAPAVSTTAASPIVPAGYAGPQVTFNASGASFPYPLYSKMFAQYNALRSGVKINYQSVGSGAGIRQVCDGSTDFGASDAPMTDAQLKEAKHGQLLHVPMTLGAVVPIYNVPGVKGPLVFSGLVLADLFRGEITRWNDPRLAALNPGVALPEVDVTIVHRSDGSGTTHVFTDYLSKVSEAFARSPGRGTTVAWPAANKVGAKGSEGVAAVVSQTPGTLSYIELTYALQNRIAYGSVVNAAGKPIRASMESVTEAAASQSNPPADLRMSITNAPGEGAYPIAAFSYLLVYRNQPDPAKADALADFLTWAVIDGQKLAPALHYAPLPAEIVARDQRIILSLTVNGRPFASAAH